MSVMPRPRPPHLSREISRRGKPVWYVRVGHGPRIRLHAAFGTEEFNREYQAALSGERPASSQKSTGNGTLAWAASLYRQSSDGSNSQRLGASATTSSGRFWIPQAVCRLRPLAERTFSQDMNVEQLRPQRLGTFSKLCAVSCAGR